MLKKKKSLFISNHGIKCKHFSFASRPIWPISVYSSNFTSYSLPYSAPSQIGLFFVSYQPSFFLREFTWSSLTSNILPRVICTAGSCLPFSALCCSLKVAFPDYSVWIRTLAPFPSVSHSLVVIVTLWYYLCCLLYLFTASLPPSPHSFTARFMRVGHWIWLIHGCICVCNSALAHGGS